MTGRRTTSLLSAVLVASCAVHAPDKPDVPASVSPGWRLSSLAKSGRPSGLAADGSPQCWKAVYAGTGSADAWICWYPVSGSAFEAAQRARAEAQTVKFQEGQYLIILRWNNTTREDVTALVRALEKSLGASPK